MINPLPHLLDMPMSLGDHLEELRRRLIVPIIAMALCFIGAFTYNKELKVAYTQPLWKAIEILGPERASELGLITRDGSTAHPTGAAVPAAPDGDDGPASAAIFKGPAGTAVDGSGNLFIVDQHAARVRRVDAISGVITTVAGNGTAGYSGDDGPATAAQLDGPTAVSLDTTGDLFITDANNRCIRKVSATTGIITTVAGHVAARSPAPAAIPHGTRILTSTNLTESAMVSMSVSFYAALALVIPLLVYQIWRFVSVGLLAKERQLAFLFVPAGIIFFYTGAVLGYFWGLPYYFAWMLEWSAADLTLKQQLVTQSLYQDSFTMMTVCFGLVMDIPWLVMVLVRVGFVTPDQLAKFRKLVILINTVVASLITPPDGTSMIAMMIPLQLLFEGGLIASRVMMWRLRKQEAREEAEAAARAATADHHADDHGGHDGDHHG